MTLEEAKKLFNDNIFDEVICGSKLCDYANTGCNDCKITHMKAIINQVIENEIKRSKNK